MFTGRGNMSGRSCRQRELGSGTQRVVDPQSMSSILRARASRLSTMSSSSRIVIRDCGMVTSLLPHGLACARAAAEGATSVSRGRVRLPPVMIVGCYVPRDSDVPAMSSVKNFLLARRGLSGGYQHLRKSRFRRGGKGFLAHSRSGERFENLFHYS